MKYCVAILILLQGGLQVVEAQRKQVVRVYRLESDRYPLEVVSRDTAMNQWLLTETEKALADSIKLLELDELPLSQLTLRWKPGNAEGLFSFPRRLQLKNEMPQMEVDFSGADRSQVVAIKRSIIIALLQAYIWQGEERIDLEIIPDPPLWLSEGVLWESLDYGHDAWRGVVDKAARVGSVPALDEIQNWDELSELRLERLWQQAFSYCLVRKTFQTRAEKRAVMLWLKDFRREDASGFWESIPSVENWWQEAAAEPMRKKIPLKDWEQSIVTLNQLRHFSVRLKDGTRKMLFIEDLPEELEIDREDSSLLEPVHQFDLLALSCHYALRPAVVRYGQAMRFWFNEEFEEYQEMMKQAKGWEQWCVTRKQSADDMLDWSVVNLSVDAGTNRNELLTNYAGIVRELEQERMRVRREFQKDIFK